MKPAPLWAVVAPFLQSIGGAATWGDAFMLVGSLAGQLLMVLQKMETWPTWIAVNTVRAVLYATQGCTSPRCSTRSSSSWR